MVQQSVTSERRIESLLANDRSSAAHPYVRAFSPSAPSLEPQAFAMARKNQLPTIPTARLLHAQPLLLDALRKVKAS